MKNIFKKQKNKEYKYKIIFKNKCESEGIIKAPNLNKVHEVLLTNKFQQVEDDTKGFYWNANEIETVEVYLLEKESD